MNPAKFALLLPLVSGVCFAQLPAPNTVLRAAPRATWNRVTSVPANAIPQRADTPGAASSDRIYVFGGCAGNNTSTTLNDLWEFDGVNCTLLTANGAAGSPHHRGRACVAWNFSTNKLVVFGGSNRATGPAAADTLFADTWEFDPATGTWTDVTPATGSPSGRQLASMTWDPTTGGMLLFGGQTSITPNLVSDETWLFLGGVWTQLTPANVPAARVMPKLVTRSDFGDVLLCGGIDGSQVTTTDQLRHLDVQIWNGSDWTKISDFDFTTMTGTFPHSVASTAAAYDPLRKRVVMQGGDGTTNGTAANTTFIYGSAYGGSPSNWTSEFDCLTNTWTIYSRKGADSAPALATAAENDAVIGRVSRFSTAFLASTGKVYKLCGQNPAASGSNPLYVFEYQADPIASAPTVGTGCSSSAGPLSLAADSLPWTTRNVTLTGTGFPAGSFGFAAIGWTQVSTPLASLHPAGGAGCDLLVTPDVAYLVLPSAGEVTFGLGLPADPIFAGAVLTAQALCFELDAQLNLSLLSSTNAVAIGIGAL